MKNAKKIVSTGIVTAALGAGAANAEAPKTNGVKLQTKDNASLVLNGGMANLNGSTIPFGEVTYVGDSFSAKAAAAKSSNNEDTYIGAIAGKNFENNYAVVHGGHTSEDRVHGDQINVKFMHVTPKGNSFGLTAGGKKVDDTYLGQTVTSSKRVETKYGDKTLVGTETNVVGKETKVIDTKTSSNSSYVDRDSVRVDNDNITISDIVRDTTTNTTTTNTIQTDTTKETTNHYEIPVTTTEHITKKTDTYNKLGYEERSVGVEGTKRVNDNWSVEANVDYNRGKHSDGEKFDYTTAGVGVNHYGKNVDTYAKIEKNFGDRDNYTTTAGIRANASKNIKFFLEGSHDSKLGNSALGGIAWTFGGGKPAKTTESVAPRTPEDYMKQEVARANIADMAMNSVDANRKLDVQTKVEETSNSSTQILQTSETSQSTTSETHDESTTTTTTTSEVIATKTENKVPVQPELPKPAETIIGDQINPSKIVETENTGDVVTLENIKAILGSDIVSYKILIKNVADGIDWGESVVKGGDKADLYSFMDTHCSIDKDCEWTMKIQVPTGYQFGPGAAFAENYEKDPVSGQITKHWGGFEGIVSIVITKEGGATQRFDNIGQIVVY